MVNCVELALVLEHYDLFFQLGSFDLLDIDFDALSTVRERHMKNFAAWGNRVIAGELVGEGYGTRIRDIGERGLKSSKEPSVA